MADEPQNPAPEDIPGDPPDGASDESALSSQDEIDALINGAGDGAPAAGDETPTEEAPGGGALDQADIDAALKAASASADGAEAADSSEPDAVKPEDIEALEQAAAAGTGGRESDDFALAGDELFSQADIDAALHGEPVSDAADAARKPTSSAGQPASAQDEIDAVLASAGQGETASDAAQPSGDVPLDSAGRPFDAAAAAMAAAIAEAGADAEGPAPAGQSPTDLPAPKALELEDFAGEGNASDTRDISILRDVDLRVHIELGRTRMYIEDVLKLSEGSVVELENLAGDPVDVIVNGRLVARGEVLVLSDNFCVRVSEVITGPQNVAVA